MQFMALSKFNLSSRIIFKRRAGGILTYSDHPMARLSTGPLPDQCSMLKRFKFLKYLSYRTNLLSKRIKES